MKVFNMKVSAALPLLAGCVSGISTRSSVLCTPSNPSDATRLKVWCNGYTPYGESSCSLLTNNLCKWDDGKASSSGAASSSSTSSGTFYQAEGTNCEGDEGLILLTDEAVQIMGSDGSITSCASGLYSANDAVLGPNGELYVVEDMMQQVKIIAPNCGEVSVLLTANDGLIRPTSIAYIPNNDGTYIIVVANSMGNSGYAFSFDSSNNQVAKQALGAVNFGMTYVNYDGTNLVGITGNKIAGIFDDSYNFVPYPDIPAIVDMRQLNSCGGFNYISADDNNDIFQCSDLSNPDTCQPLCPMANGEVGVTNPWSIGIGTDCSVYTASRGPGAGKIFKYDASTCYQPVEIGSISNGGQGIKTIIPFFVSPPGDCAGYEYNCEKLCQGTPVQTCSHPDLAIDCGSDDQVDDFATKPCDAATQNCQELCCTPKSIDGKWSEWSSGPCSRSCGGGSLTRERTCSNPAPANGGNDCAGESSEEQTCNNDPCAVDGKWSEWSSGPCSVSCGGGSLTRERTCSNPAPANGGNDCAGDSSEEQSCNNDPCAVDGQWSEWSSGPCSVSCGGGSLTRERTCSNPAPANGGKECAGEISEEQTCNNDHCAVDGKWSEWSPGPCSVSCGGGSLTRERTCTNPAPANGGNDCAGESFEEQTCNNDPCAVDGKWSEWSLGPCSVSCGGGSLTRERTCTNPAPANGGNDCAGESSEEQTCNNDPCAVDGKWSEWSSGPCSVSCGGGSLTRERTCTNPAPANGGNDCVGESSEEQTCNNDPCAVDGKWSEWSLGPCSVSCGGGSLTRERTCTNPAPANGGNDCAGFSSEEQTCNNDPCAVDGKWSEWSSGPCSVSCGGGSLTRERTCSNPAPANGGSDCAGESSVEQTCNNDPCAVDGKWSEWSTGPCSVSCGGGSLTRERTCSNPAPANGGQECAGDSSEEKECNKDPCPTNGDWSPWQPWGDCSAECGGGITVRSRKCDDPSPANGGADCAGPSDETKTCNEEKCVIPVDGGWTQWTTYGPCSKSCGSGTKTSTRSCTNPKPANGGAQCVGTGSRTQDCNTHGCNAAPTCSSLNYDCGSEVKDSNYNNIECDVSLGHNCQGRCCNPVDECNPWTQETCGPECQTFNPLDPDSYGSCCDGDFGCKVGICHSNGCDQCKDGFFKPDYTYDCLKCSETIDHCQFCQDFNGCGQCEQGYRRKLGGRCNGVNTDFYVCVPEHCPQN